MPAIQTVSRPRPSLNRAAAFLRDRRIVRAHPSTIAQLQDHPDRPLLGYTVVTDSNLTLRVLFLGAGRPLLTV